MLFRVQTPPCSHGGSHFALRSKTNPTATPRGASEPAEQTLTRATIKKLRRKSVDLCSKQPMVVFPPLVWLQERKKRGGGRRLFPPHGEASAGRGPGEAAHWAGRAGPHGGLADDRLVVSWTISGNYK